MKTALILTLALMLAAPTFANEKAAPAKAGDAQVVKQESQPVTTADQTAKPAAGDSKKVKKLKAKKAHDHKTK